MSHSIRYEVPHTRNEIFASLQSVDKQATALWRKFSALDFFLVPASGGWSPAQNVEHLIKSTRPVTLALKLPGFVLRLMFGAAHAPSRSFVEIRKTYHTVLTAGAQAGEFAPRNVLEPDNPAAARDRVLAKWQALVPGLTSAMRRWDDAALDHYRLPHPLLGKLTVREMLYFTLYHLGHHAAIVAERRAA